MRFGVVLPHFRSVATMESIRDVAQSVEGLGFDSVWVTDRAAIPAGPVQERFGPEFYDPYVTLSYVAAITRRVRLGASVFVLPFRHPVIAARAIASIDRLSGGRLTVGVGAGWMHEEFEAAGVPFERRGRLTDEYLDAMIALWSSSVASFTGPTVRFERLVSEPRPVQQPYPPIWVGGGTPAALRRTVRYGAGWHGSPTPSFGELVSTVEALRDEAVRQGRDPAGIELTTRAPLRFTSDSAATGGDGYATGTPDGVAAAIHRYAAAGFAELDFDTFFAHPALDDAPTPAAMLRTLEMFAREVMPVFKGGEER